MKQQYKDFLGQIEAARKDVDERIPSWMKESVKVATLTYPTTRSEVVDPHRSQHAKKKN